MRGKGTMASFARSTSAHGIHWLADSGSAAERILWIFLIIGAVVFFSATAYNTVEDFVSEPGYSTTLGFKSLSDENGNFEIPNIMICDPYPWKASAIKALGVDNINLTSYISYMLFPQSSTEMITLMSRDPTILGKIHAVYHQVLKQFDNNPYTLIENITVKCEDLVAACNFGLDEPVYLKNCCATIFGPPKYVTGHKCFSTLGKLKKLKPTVGELFALNMALSAPINDDKLIDIPIASSKAILNHGSGLRITIVDEYSHHHSTALNFLENLSPDTANTIAVTKTYIDNTNKARDIEPVHCQTWIEDEERKKKIYNTDECVYNLIQEI
ncbi:uncharacterized protein LOC111712632 [Eurytemora carolleeae]|uniref:uncharacterized protein LOC111712632 n=1 Tax=Eurytemora carolleeae TaxID=1294199 RepID=UPI000C773838|nr:uncharacterized protein LOC111712632 [Eurytemora carolleeae]|eukprot:XP_023343079.1 uncharacterized protein LOC111712632 [Eurytemora affinis]